jgi:mxaL protein
LNARGWSVLDAQQQFSGHRVFLLITPIEICANYRELTGIVGRIDWRMSWEARSEVAKGLHKGIELMRALGEDTRVVFMTDGHEAPPINPDVPPQFTGEKGAIGGVLVGVGGTKPVPIPKFDANGERQGFWQADEVLHIDTFNADRIAREGGAAAALGTEHLSSLRETYLEHLAGQTGLAYHRLDDAAALSRLLQSDAYGSAKVVTADLRWLYALVALAALVGSLVIELVGRWRGRMNDRWPPHTAVQAIGEV